MRKTYDVERVLVTIALVIVLVSALLDYFEDASAGASWLDLAVDSLLNIFIVFTLFYIWRKRPNATEQRNQHLEKVLKRSDQSLKDWQAKAAGLLKGLGAKIDEQLDSWQLTYAEKEVALLLIKGMSTKEVALYRGTSEKTVRQQASHVYAKANLENRAELAAFFLEDLLLPKP